MWKNVIKTMLLLFVVSFSIQTFAIDESNLDEVVQKTKEMYESGVDKKTIAEFVNRVVDNRIYCSNNSEAFWRPIWSAGQVMRVRWDDDEKGEYNQTAPDSWEIGYGNCQENSAITYYILKEAGVKENLRVLRTKSHSFCVWDLPPTAQTNDPGTWGNAMIVDPWYGEVLDGPEVGSNYWFQNDDPVANTINDATIEIDLEADSWANIQREEERRTGEKIVQEDDYLSSLEDCFIATAVYGTPINNEIQILRQFRDQHLRTNFAGRIFISVYEIAGPVFAYYIKQDETRKEWARKKLVEPALQFARQKINTQN